ncbi:MAG TPA: heavy metal-responsive transcriptional regulator [Pyrinomonadaceae bacterium]|nr:heavy metal-responsive transcriptional regulator [Pyrinomonadaceae bacterium]
MPKAANKNGPWRVGELARAAGVSADTLRYYEKKKVLRATRSSNGYRHYPAEALERVRMIRQALAIGFSLDELQAVFKVLEGGGAPCHEVRQLAADKLATIEMHLADLKALRDELKNSLRDWDARLAATPAGARAGLLKALGGHELPRSASSLLLHKRKTMKKGNEND